MKSNIVPSLVLASLFFALPATAAEKEKTPPRSEQIVTIYGEREESFKIQNRNEVEEDLPGKLERGRSRLEQRFSPPEKRNDLEQSLLIRKL